MEFKYIEQQHQTDAVNAVIECFDGQTQDISSKNAEITDNGIIYENVCKVQERLTLPISNSLNEYQRFDEKKKKLVKTDAKYVEKINKISPYNLDIEMETGTGKTYCYIKTIFELNKYYGWNKFIVMVPSIAIREGVRSSFEDTAEHFHGIYGKKARAFVYSSDSIDSLNDFNEDQDIHVMIINTQVFNTTNKSQRRIYEELDELQSRRPIDVISETRPILILDEPQKMGGEKTLKMLPEFNPLMVLRYSATHNYFHNVVYRLDAVDAYREKLVKKIFVSGIHTRGDQGGDAFMFLAKVETTDRNPVAILHMEKKKDKGIGREWFKIELGDDLYEKSGKLEAYRDDYVVTQIDYTKGQIEFSNGKILEVGKAEGDVSENIIRRFQIRETIDLHIQRESVLYSKNIKVLSLFFIDRVANYRDYDKENEKGEYAEIFEEEYENAKKEFINKKYAVYKDYCEYLKGMPADKVHNGYFSIDKKTNRLKDSTGNKETGSDDVDAYNLILKNKKRLLSFGEPTRFIFSHSALREGWDNPNIFVMCMLKQSDNTMSRRQEVGRGLRLCVNQDGFKMNNPSEVHEINILNVVSNESYMDFVNGLQSEISDSLINRCREANVEYFIGKKLMKGEEEVVIDRKMAKKIHAYLTINEYINVEDDTVSDKYRMDRKANSVVDFPDNEIQSLKEGIVFLIDELFSEKTANEMVSDRIKKNPINEKNLKKEEFQKLWKKINKKMFYTVEFESEKLIENCVKVLNKGFRIIPSRILIDRGEQTDQKEFIKSNLGSDSLEGAEIYSNQKYDLIGKIADKTNLTRLTISKILTRMDDKEFSKFKQNPEQAISEVSKIIKEQLSFTVVQCLTYHKTNNEYDSEIFTCNEFETGSTNVTDKLKKHVHDYVVADSDVEKNFAYNLDSSNEVVVFSKLPKGFSIPTPLGNYNPDWAIAFDKDKVRYVYFIAETKADTDFISLRPIEKGKIQCAEKYFEKISENGDEIKYHAVKSFNDLMNEIILR